MKLFGHSESSDYISVLDKLLDEYNNRYHTSIKMTPFEASNPENTRQVIKNLYPPEKIDKKQAYKVGDRVGQMIILPYPKVEFEDNKLMKSAKAMYLNAGVIGSIDSYLKIAKENG